MGVEVIEDGGAEGEKEDAGGLLQIDSRDGSSELMDAGNAAVGAEAVDGGLQGGGIHGGEVAQELLFESHHLFFAGELEIFFAVVGIGDIGHVAFAHELVNGDAGDIGAQAGFYGQAGGGKFLRGRRV